MRIKTALIVCLTAGAISAWAQRPLMFDAEGVTRSVLQKQNTGRSDFVVFPLSENRFSFPLRFGSVIEGSERVEVGGITLRRDVDYSIDYLSGTIFIRRRFNPGATATVSYRYDKETGVEGEFGGSNNQQFTGLSFNISPGNAALLSMGITERDGNDNVITSNLFGFANSMSFGAGKISGVLAMSQRDRADYLGLMGDAAPKDGDHDEGTGTAIVQALQTSALGGNLKLEYQDIEENFRGFSAFSAAGYSQAEVNQFQKEKGLKRFGFSASDLGSDSFAFSGGMRNVEDEQGSIEWTNYGVNAGSIGFNYSRQYVDSEFNSFKQLADRDFNGADWKQLQKERELERQFYGLDWGFGGESGLSFNAMEVTDTGGAAFSRHSLNLDTNWASIAWAEQSLDSDFNRTGDLRNDELSPFAAMLGTNSNKELGDEMGMNRRYLQFQTDSLGGPLSYTARNLTGDSGGFKSIDAKYEGNGFLIEHWSRAANSGFDGLRALTKEEQKDHAEAILRMYGDKAKVQGSDQNAFVNGAGIGRSAWKFASEFGNSWAFDYDRVDINGTSDQGDVQTFALNGPGFGVEFRDQSFGAGLEGDLRNLMPSEEKMVGDLADFERQDFSFNAQLGGARKVNGSALRADHRGAGLERELFSFVDKGFQLEYAHRSIDPNFERARSLVDPERDLLNRMIGFDQTEMQLKWSLLSSLNIDMSWMEADNNSLDRQMHNKRYLANWKPDASTAIHALRHEYGQGVGGSLGQGTVYDKFLITRSFGSFGTLTFIKETEDFGGTDNALPDAERNTVIFETDISDTTAFRTEQSEKTYENGDSERVNKNTVSTALSNRTGVSVTDVQIQREGDLPDESFRDYGFWVDFGNNIKLTYGYAQRLMSDGTGEKIQNGASITGGEFGGFALDGSSYNRSYIQDQNDVHKGIVGLRATRPFDVLGLFTVDRLDFKVNTDRGNYVWKKEDQNFGFDAHFGDINFGYDYSSHIFAQDQSRVIDREFRVNTPMEENDWLGLDLRYKVRTLPWEEDVMIRDFKFFAQPMENLRLTHSMLTNPESNKNVFYGQQHSDHRKNEWNLKYTGDPKLHAEAAWIENRWEGKNLMTREAGVRFTINADNPSPITIGYFYGQEDRNGKRKTHHTFELGYTRAPGPTNSFSVFLSNRFWENGRPNNEDDNHWSMRFEYLWKF